LAAAEKLAPDDVNIHWRLARLYRVMGKSVEARAEFEKADKLNKQEDTNLFQKIENGQKRPAPTPDAPQP
jgi:hypothetical protein